MKSKNTLNCIELNFRLFYLQLMKNKIINSKKKTVLSSKVHRQPIDSQQPSILILHYSHHCLFPHILVERR